MPIGGDRVAIGFAGLVDGPLDEPGARERALEKAAACGYLSSFDNPEVAAMTPSARTTTSPSTARAPATGSGSATRPDRRVESDSQAPGDEFLAGFGKTARDGLHLKAAAVRDTCDLVISNVLVIDPVHGIGRPRSASATAGSTRSGAPGTRTP